MPGSGPTPLDATQGPDAAQRRGGTDRRHRRTAVQYGRYGYRRIAALLGSPGRAVNVKRVERIWRRGAEGPGTAAQASPALAQRRIMHPAAAGAAKPRLVLQLRQDRTHDGRKFRMLNVIDEFTRECIAIRIGRLRSADVIDVLSDLFILRGAPGHVRSDNGLEFAAKAVREWIVAVGSRTAFIEPGSPWENGFRESFNASFCLNASWFLSLADACDRIEGLEDGYKPNDPFSLGRLDARGLRSPRSTSAKGRMVTGREPAL